MSRRKPLQFLNAVVPLAPIVPGMVLGLIVEHTLVFKLRRSE
jgi:hypothetical protein